MMLKAMKAIEYNVWMTMLDTITTRIPIIASDYGLTGIVLKVIPSYPKDLSNFTKPSIIVQKVSSDQDSMAFGNFIGQHFDVDHNSYVDVTGKLHRVTFQVNIDAEGNIQQSLLVSALTEGILGGASNPDDPDSNIVLMDYIHDPKNPTPMGVISMDRDIDTMNMQSNMNNDYITAIRFDVTVVQSVVLPQELIDLSKGFKYNQTIKL